MNIAIAVIKLAITSYISVDALRTSSAWIPSGADRDTYPWFDVTLHGQ
jgi:hypothetical protein